MLNRHADTIFRRASVRIINKQKYKPVTRMRPLWRLRRQTTRLPLYLPARTIAICPGLESMTRRQVLKSEYKERYKGSKGKIYEMWCVSTGEEGIQTLHYITEHVLNPILTDNPNNFSSKEKTVICFAGTTILVVSIEKLISLLSRGNHRAPEYHFGWPMTINQLTHTA